MQAEAELLARLKAVRGQLADALQKQELQRLAAIDLELRGCLEELATLAHPDEELQRVRQQLKQLHMQAMQACTSACEKLRQTLLTHLEYAEGRSAYSRIESFSARS